MRRIYFSLLLLAILTLTASCNKEDNLNRNGRDCIFEQNDEDMDGIVDETERLFMKEARRNAFTSKEEIKENLIGEWNLVGYAQGRAQGSQPCGYIIVSADQLTFEFDNGAGKKITTSAWDIEDLTWSGGQYFRLKVFPEYIEGLGIIEFSPNLMFGDARIGHGNMYLYKKVK